MARGEAIVGLAFDYRAVAFRSGGADPSGWDGAGLVYYLYRQVAGIELPPTAGEQFVIGVAVPPEEVRPGDIVFFDGVGGPGTVHCGIALGDGRFIHMPSAGEGMTISNLTEPYWESFYAGARRP